MKMLPFFKFVSYISKFSCNCPGCTGYLEDWHIVGQLIPKGRTHIDLTIVDENLIKESVDGLLQLSKALQEEGV